ncbi:hypothetical protein HAX54_033532 [Datura stramonium]|uniref:Uncharacterized protein n=1 Tax=Datura stramonium TaxID=4076 RepID=A0ABS8RM84_DATST|nr:hypothetical protein [Datura stramonium]
MGLRCSLSMESRSCGSMKNWGELHLLLDRCVGQRARGTCCPPFLLYFENRVNVEWAEEKELAKREAGIEEAPPSSASTLLVLVLVLDTR